MLQNVVTRIMVSTVRRPVPVVLLKHVTNRLEHVQTHVLKGLWESSVKHVRNHVIRKMTVTVIYDSVML